MTMKNKNVFFKIFTIILFYILTLFLSTPSIHAAYNPDPLDVYEGPFGPEIAGLQLGLRLDLSTLLLTGLQWFGSESMELEIAIDRKTDEASIMFIGMEKPQNLSDIVSNSSKWKVATTGPKLSPSTLREKTERNNWTLQQYIDFFKTVLLKEKGTVVVRGPIAINPYTGDLSSSFGFQNSISLNYDGRVKEFILRPSVWNIRNGTVEEFASFLLERYPSLGDDLPFVNNQVSLSKPEEGWELSITNRGLVVRSKEIPLPDEERRDIDRFMHNLHIFIRRDGTGLNFRINELINYMREFSMYPFRLSVDGSRLVSKHPEMEELDTVALEHVTFELSSDAPSRSINISPEFKRVLDSLGETQISDFIQSFNDAKGCNVSFITIESNAKGERFFVKLAQTSRNMYGIVDVELTPGAIGKKMSAREFVNLLKRYRRYFGPFLEDDKKYYDLADGDRNHSIEIRKSDALLSTKKLK